MKFNFTIAIIIVIFSCTERKAASDLQYMNYKKGNLVLTLDSVSSYEFYWTQLINSGKKSTLINLNKVVNSLDFYALDSNLSKGFLEKRIPLNTPDKFNGTPVQGFFFHNIDSIFLFPQFTLNGTTLIDGKGTVQKKYRLSIPVNSEISQALNHVSSPSSETVLVKDKLYASAATLTNTSKNEGISDSFRAIVVADLESETVYMNTEVGYPSQYIGKSVTNHHAFLTRTFVSDSLWVHSYPMLDSLQIYDKEYNFLKSVPVPSDHFKSFSETPKNIEQSDQVEFIVTQDSYGRIVYDPFRKLYYRFVLHGRKISDLESLEPKSSHKNNFSIIVTDSDFIKLNEIVFPGEIYHNYSALVSPKGLLLPKINHFYNGLNDEWLEYDIFSF
ncbi:DUF4221 family protein [Algoriphagus namhaensis]